MIQRGKALSSTRPTASRLNGRGSSRTARPALKPTARPRRFPRPWMATSSGTTTTGPPPLWRWTSPLTASPLSPSRRVSTRMTPGLTSAGSSTSAAAPASRVLCGTGVAGASIYLKELNRSTDTKRHVRITTPLIRDLDRPFPSAAAGPCRTPGRVDMRARRQIWKQGERHVGDAAGSRSLAMRGGKPASAQALLYADNIDCATKKWWTGSEPGGLYEASSTSITSGGVGGGAWCPKRSPCRSRRPRTASNPLMGRPPGN